ncbi:TerD domain-containing protein [Cladochytrium replicatum]|nr:TerD domain-containing protein [Cladochytrium replicatum]
MRINNDVTIKIVEARGLRGADKGGTSSDPFAKIKNVKGLHLPGNDDHYKTKVVKKNLNPKWGESFNLKFDDRLSKIAFLIFDWDMLSSNDRIGKAKIPVEQLFGNGGNHTVVDRWLPVTPQGELHVIIEVYWKIPIALPGVSFPIPYTTTFSVGLGWDMAKKGKVVDLDASVAAISDAGAVLDSVSFKKLTGMNGSVRHSGDDRTGDGDADDEVITFDASKMPAQFTRFVVTINSFTQVPLSQARSAYVRVSTPQKGTIAFFRINSLTNDTGLLLGQVWRTSDGWFFASGRQSGGGRTITESLPWIISHAVSPSAAANAVAAKPTTPVPGYAQPPAASAFAPPPAQPYRAPSPVQPYGVPPTAQPYGAPPAGAPQPYGAPPSGTHQPYGAPPSPQPPYGAPPTGAHQPYGAPQPYAAPPAGAPYGPPPTTQPYGAPQPYGTTQPYGGPPAGQPYGAPPQPYGAPAPYAPPPGAAPVLSGYQPPNQLPAYQPQQQYGAPYGAPAPPQPYGAPYGAPAQAYGYGAPPPSAGYGAPPPAAGYGAPPPAAGYGAPTPANTPASQAPPPVYQPAPTQH